MIAVSCTRYGQAPVPSDYHVQLDAWIETRITNLKAPTGWLRLSGMIWLDEGVTTFEAGQVLRSDTLVYHADSLVFDGSTAKIVENGPYRWTIIRRSDLLGIRIWNTVNAQVDSFSAIPRYPTDTTFIRAARFKKNPVGTTLRVVNILGQIENVPSPGVLEFDIDGTRYTLDALIGGERMFVILGDATNRTETYQGGRYMYIDYPAEGTDRTVIDFNKAYNPPCAFTPYSTCQLPPKQNVLPISIPAGEKRPN